MLIAIAKRLATYLLLPIATVAVVYVMGWWISVIDSVEEEYGFTAAIALLIGSMCVVPAFYWAIVDGYEDWRGR